MIRPGSTIKPFTLLALIGAGKLAPSDSFLCPGVLSLNGEQVNCSHPKLGVPMNAARAIAYSCNCAVAQFAARLLPAELKQTLLQFGFTSASGLLRVPEAKGRIANPATPDSQKLQAIGQDGLSITPLELLEAYRRLALRIHEPPLAAILEGMEGAVNYGTAQRAALDKIQVAGKTGSVEISPGIHAAWFAGFAPSRRPRVVTVIATQGFSGGADAAPVAKQLLRDYFKDEV